jgi:type IV secretory pathway TrbD component
MNRLKLWVSPLVGVVVWLTVVSYAISALATVEPTLRRIGLGA